ncbi:MAG: hypothetical protein CMJ32_07665 [Phycisphaerae bacterium]|nr:hypothetical protein [Phycisphaerae bacterium]
MDWDVANAMIRAVELKDLSTAAHTWRVTLYAQAVAEALKLAPENVYQFMQAAALHDIGKIDIPHGILAKPGRLTDEEYEIVKMHTVLGHERLVRMGETDPTLLTVVRHHHERLDGSGYPDGLESDMIPQPARRFGVIDTFDAMTSIRPYREEIGEEAARASLAELERHKGTWYCPHTVDLFHSLYDSGRIDWILHHFNDKADLSALGAVPDPDRLEMAEDIIKQTEQRIDDSTPE